MSIRQSGAPVNPKICARCGCIIINNWFDFGNGIYLCVLCQSRLNDPSYIIPLDMTPMYPPVDETHQEALREITRLTAELAKANRRIAELEAMVKAIRDVVGNEPGETV
jgi:hypothetical protein